MNTSINHFKPSSLLAHVRAVAGALALGAMVTSTAQAHDGNSVLPGTWRVAVTTYNCDTLVASPAFTSYLTFGVDGTLVETTGNQLFQPGQRSSGHGFWERNGRHHYRAVSEAFIQFSTAPPLPALARGSQRIDQGIQVINRNHFESDATVTFFDTAGAVLITGCARAEGERLE